MLRISVETNNREPLYRYLSSFLPGQLDLTDFAHTCASVMRDDNRTKLLLSRDVLDQPLEPLADSTIKDSRRRPGGPLAPGGDLATLVTVFQTAVTHPEPNVWIVTGQWVGADWLQYHMTGASKGNWHLPIRDIVGIRESAMAEMAGELEGAIKKLVGGA